MNQAQIKVLKDYIQMIAQDEAARTVRISLAGGPTNRPVAAEKASLTRQLEVELQDDTYIRPAPKSE